MNLFRLLILCILMMIASSGPTAALECEVAIHGYCVTYCIYLLYFGGPLYTSACIITCTAPLHTRCAIALFIPAP